MPTVDQREVTAPAIQGLQLIKKIGTRLMIADAAIGLGSLNVDRSLIVETRNALKLASGLVEDGTLGYGLIVAQRVG